MTEHTGQSGQDGTAVDSAGSSASGQVSRRRLLAGLGVVAAAAGAASLGLPVIAAQIAGPETAAPPKPLEWVSTQPGGHGGHASGTSKPEDRRKGEPASGSPRSASR